MSRAVPRQLLTDAGLALALLAVTVGPGLVSGLLTPQKVGDPTSFASRAGIPPDVAWWAWAALALAGVVIRRRRPAVALVLTSVGTTGHLLLQTKFQLLVLALPLVLYTVATVARRRRLVLGALAATMILTYLAMLGSRLDLVHDQAAAAKKLAQQHVAPVEAVRPTTAEVPVDALVDAGQSALEMWLLLVAAYAVGDSVRSRRAHLAAVEARAADQARQERQRAALAVAAERTRITRELHDVVAHGMSVMVVQAQGAAAALDRHPERSATALRHVIEVGRSSLSEMRRLLAAERTDEAEDARLTPLPGVGVIPDLVDQLRSAGMRIDLEIEGEPAVVPAAVDLSAYRIVQEALTNSLKHAGTGAGARVRLRFEPRSVRVEVTDDGAGPPDGVDGYGNGLRGIAERVALLGGALETGRAPDRGFRLAATLPLEARR
ncbi:sensor histidine kinase [Asanoa siamensis]|nr:sensor histidine kinase [Asanoa siamensis]